MQRYGPSTYGDGFADVYDDWYGTVSDIEVTVHGVQRLADGGPILELGVGTGRLAIPIAETGIDVVGIDASMAMIDQLRAKAGSERVATIQADMSALPLIRGRFSMVFAAFNTFFNLIDAPTQHRCLRNVRHSLRDGGCLVIEAFVPPRDGLRDGGVSLREESDERAIVTVSAHDAERQRIDGRHVEVTPSHTRTRHWVLHYRTPAQLDEAASRAGFTLESRSSDWAGSPFTETAESHVSVYRAGPAPTDGSP